MTLTGHIVGGQIVLETPIPLPDGTEVRVEPIVVPTGDTANASGEASASLDQRLKNFLKHVVELPEDAALNHDRHLYSSPKQ